jgi:death on curing protein
VIHLDLADLLHIARRTLGGDPPLRDAGLLEAAVARTRTTVGGHDAYPSLEEKAAALVHSVVRNHALIDGNKRLGLAALVVFLRANGRTLTMTNDDAYAFIMAIAAGALDDVDEIAERIRVGTTVRA